MQAFERFKNMDASFWAFVKYVSENFGYTERNKGLVKHYSINTIKALCAERGINASEETIVNVALYSKMRADLLNRYVESMLMDAETAGK